MGGGQRLGSGRDPPDLVAVKLREPQRAIRPCCNAVWGTASRGNSEFGDDTRGGDPPDLVFVNFDEPQRAVRPRRDAPGLAVRRGNREFGEDASGRDPPDLVGGILSEPQRAIRPRRDVIGAAADRGNRKFGEGEGLRRRYPRLAQSGNRHRADGEADHQTQFASVRKNAHVGYSPLSALQTC